MKLSEYQGNTAFSSWDVTVILCGSSKKNIVNFSRLQKSLFSTREIERNRMLDVDAPAATSDGWTHSSIRHT